MGYNNCQFCARVNQNGLHRCPTTAKPGQTNDNTDVLPMLDDWHENPIKTYKQAGLGKTMLPNNIGADVISVL